MFPLEPVHKVPKTVERSLTETEGMRDSFITATNFFCGLVLTYFKWKKKKPNSINGSRFSRICYQSRVQNKLLQQVQRTSETKCVVFMGILLSEF